MTNSNCVRVGLGCYLHEKRKSHMHYSQILSIPIMHLGLGDITTKYSLQTHIPVHMFTAMSFFSSIEYFKSILFRSPFPIFLKDYYTLSISSVLRVTWRESRNSQDSAYITLTLIEFPCFGTVILSSILSVVIQCTDCLSLIKE